MQYDYLIDDIAQIELNSVASVYEAYFAKFGELQKGIEWADSFYETYEAKIEELKTCPTKYHVCTLYPFNLIETDYRTFTVGWFTVFYTVEKNTFTIWHIRSSSSDFTQLRMR